MRLIGKVMMKGVRTRPIWLLLVLAYWLIVVDEDEAEIESSELESQWRELGRYLLSGLRSPYTYTDAIANLRP